MPLLRSAQFPSKQPSAYGAAGAVGYSLFRFGLLAFGGILAMASFWLTTVTLMRPAVPYFINKPEQITSVQERGAFEAARFALLSGNLWLDDAIVSAAAFLSEHGDSSPQSAALLEDARAAAAQAARLAPHEARAWLLLSILELKSGVKPPGGMLKMAYFTGGNNAALIPLRLNAVARSAAIADPDLQTLAEQDVRTMVADTRLHADLRSTYAQASAAGKRYLDAKVGGLDQGLLGQIQKSPELPF